MLKEQAVVALLKDLPDSGLRAGDIGTIVDVREKSGEFLVEFTDDHARLVALAGLRPEQIRPLATDEPAMSRVVRV